MGSVLLPQVAPGMLITFLQKGLAYVGIEEHLNEVGYWRGLLIQAPLNKHQTQNTDTFKYKVYSSSVDPRIRKSLIRT